MTPDKIIIYVMIILNCVLMILAFGLIFVFLFAATSTIMAIAVTIKEFFEWRKYG